MLNVSNILAISAKLPKASSCDNIMKICQDLDNLNSSHKLPTSTSLDQSSLEHRSIQDILFHVIYKWKCRNFRASSKTLAQTLMELGHYKEAYSIDPTCKLTII